jgi:DNA-binding NtrC family response regulator
VLVVDDEPGILRVLTRELSRDFEVQTARSPSEALGLWEGEGQVCAVVSDLHMGGGPTGITLLQEVQRRAPTCVRILVSAVERFDQVQDALASGVVHRFLSKPWLDGQVLATLREALKPEV